ncbi:MAG: DUF937 domain-containing protein [Hyphomicrobiales bacterium]|nr:DUF937 domain-containing protein [Hyphomicrobiales bacterium]
MVNNLVDMMRQALTPALIAEIGSKIGLDQAKAQAIADAALPAMLGGLAASAGTPAGAQAIASAIANQDPAVMDDVLAARGGEQTLSGLLGEGRMDQIAAAVGQIAAAPAATVRAVMGALAPAALGAIGQQDPATWANGAAITNLFADHKDAIAAAMPAGLDAVIAGALPGTLRQGLPQAGAAMPRAGAPSAAPGGMPPWTWGVLGLVVLAGAYSYFTHKAAAPPPAAPAATSAPARPMQAPAATTAPAPDVKAITKAASDALGGVEATLGSITDAASAAAALPKLVEAGDGLGKLDGALAALPPAAKTAVAAATAPAVSKIDEATTRIEALPGLAATIKPALEALKARVDALNGS